MTRQVNIHNAKTHLSQLIQEAIDGDEIVIAKAGRPIARLLPYQPPVPTRKPGVWRSQVEIAADFDKLPPELTAAFQGNAQ